MKHRIRLDYIVICEDIRQEVGRKPSAMGIFTDDILVRDFPYLFPKFCFLVHLIIEKPCDSFRLSATFNYTGKEPIALAKGEKVSVEGKVGGAVLNFIMSPLTFDAEGTGELFLELDGGKYRRTFSVKKAVNPSVFSG